MNIIDIKKEQKVLKTTLSKERQARFFELSQFYRTFQISANPSSSDPSTAVAIITSPPFFRQSYALLALERRARGKQINFQLSPEVIRNDAVDMLYVTQASYFDGFFCHETTSKRVYGWLRTFFSSSELTDVINRYSPDPVLLQMGVK